MRVQIFVNAKCFSFLWYKISFKQARMKESDLFCRSIVSLILMTIKWAFDICLKAFYSLVLLLSPFLCLLLRIWLFSSVLIIAYRGLWLISRVLFFVNWLKNSRNLENSRKLAHSKISTLKTILGLAHSENHNWKNWILLFGNI